MNWFIEGIKEFYKNEENVKSFEEWKKKKKLQKNDSERRRRIK